MYPLNDNDLDRLSREAAEQYDVDQNTSGWDALENRLNRELPLKEERERRRFLFWLFFIVLLAGGGLLWTMTNKTNNTVGMTGTNTVPSATENKNTNAPVVPSSPNPGMVQEGAATPSSSATTVIPAPVSGQPDATTPGAPVVSSAKKNSASINPVGTEKVTADKLLSDRANKKDIAAGRKNKRSPRLTDKGKVPSGAIDNYDNYMVPIGHVSDRDNGNAHPLKASMVSGIDWENNIGAIKAPPLTIAATENADGKKTPPKKKDNQNRGFEIGLVAGPDMSNVKFTDMDKMGYNVGLQIGYRFSDRWSVNTGFFYTKKNYTAQGKDWSKTGSWWQNRELISVQGYCEMFEIPLNVRYDFSVSKKQRWFASTGASSYIMTGEYYNYDYIYGGDRRQWNAERDSTSTYLFSILNLSAGFERSLSKRFSIQAEPYLKLPLKGLGYGKLDLNSYGIYFSAKYRFGK